MFDKRQIFVKKMSQTCDPDFSEFLRPAIFSFSYTRSRDRRSARAQYSRRAKTKMYTKTANVVYMRVAETRLLFCK